MNPQMFSLHLLVVLLSSGAGLSAANAAVNSLPSPNVPWDRQALKSFVYDFAHLFLSSRSQSKDAPNPLPTKEAGR